MTRLVLVRHGQTVWHAGNRYAGSSDIDLTERGREQADELAEWARTAGLAAVWCSTLKRAKLTAQKSAQAAGASMHVDERLRELDFGQGEGLTGSDMERAFPDALHAFREDPVANHLPGGEDPRLAASRFVECLADIASQHPRDRVLVVAHTTSIRLALCQLVGIPLSEYRRLFPSIGNCALTEIKLRGPRVALMQFNVPVGRGSFAAENPLVSTSAGPSAG